MTPLPKRRHSTMRKGKRRAARVLEFLQQYNIPLRKKKGAQKES